MSKRIMAFRTQTRRIDEVVSGEMFILDDRLCIVHDIHTVKVLGYFSPQGLRCYPDNIGGYKNVVGHEIVVCLIIEKVPNDI